MFERGTGLSKKGPAVLHELRWLLVLRTGKMH